jgi:RNA polymerase sigma factor (sigma-70 family)
LKIRKDYLNETLSDESESFSQILEAELLPKFAYAIEQLAPQGKQVIKMIYFGGKNIRMVAEALVVSQSTVKTQKGRSIIKLKKILTIPPNH